MQTQKNHELSSGVWLPRHESQAGRLVESHRAFNLFAFVRDGLGSVLPAWLPTVVSLTNDRLSHQTDRLTRMYSQVLADGRALTNGYTNSMVESGIRTASRSQSEVAVGCCQSLAGQCDHDAKQCSDKEE